jgi:DNA-binding protein HU-beta
MNESYIDYYNLTSVDTPKIRLKMRLIINFAYNSMANKMDLVEKVAATIGSTKADAERAVEALITMITDCLKRGEEVSIAGLGIFEAKTRAGRTGRNPRTGQTIQIKAMKVPKFRASKTLKDAVK